MTLSQRALSDRTRTQSGDLAHVSGTRLTGSLPREGPVTPSLHPHPSNVYRWAICLAQGFLGGWRTGHKEAPSYTSAPLLSLSTALLLLITATGNNYRDFSAH